jgi:glycosyltransferase involved in cell wall biosynthesis
MNIFIVNNSAIPPSLGGLVRHYYFSKILTKFGYKVRILTASQIHNTDINMADEGNNLITIKEIDDVQYSFIRTLSYTQNNWRRVYSMVQFSFNCVKAIKKLIKIGDKPDVIYLSSPSPFCCYTVMKFAKKNKIPCLQEIRDLWPLSITAYDIISEQNILVKILYKLEKWLYTNADKLIFTMAGGKDYIREKGWDKSIDLSKINQINNGVYLEEFKYNLANYQLNDSDLDKGEQFKIVFTGSVRHVYQLETIIETARLCQKTLPSVHIYIYGEGPEKNRLLELVEQYDLKNISFKGRIEKKYIASILSKADVTLMHFKQVDLAKYGVSPNKLFEYCAARKPILSTVNTNYSLIKQYNCGLETQSQEPAVICEAIKYFVNLKPEDRIAMGKRAYEVALKHDYTKLTLKLLDIINDLRIL